MTEQSSQWRDRHCEKWFKESIKRTEGLDDEWNVRDECVFMRELERGIERQCVCFSSCAFDVWLCVCVHEICAQLYIYIQVRV